jgi:hypothetical protein
MEFENLKMRGVNDGCGLHASSHKLVVGSEQLAACSLWLEAFNEEYRII